MSDEAASARGPLFAARTMLWVVLTGVFAFSAFVVLSAYAPDLRSGSDGGAHALSKSAVGFAGVVELLKGADRPVDVSRGEPPPTRSGSGVLILTPNPTTDPKDIAAIHFTGLKLIVLPKWATAPSPLSPDWVLKLGQLPEGAVTHSLDGALGKTHIEQRKGAGRPVLRAGSGAGFPVGEVMPLGQVDSLQTLSGPGWDPVVTDDQGKVVLALSRRGGIAVLTDPDLLNTQGIADLKTARAGVEILDRLRDGGPVIFDVTLNGFGRGRSLLKLAFEPPLLGATLCLVAAALMMGLHAAVRFGPIEPPPPVLALGKRALADNSAALVRMARREPRMAGAYAVLTREAAARAVGAPRDLSEGQLDALLDRLGARHGLEDRFSSLAAEAAAAKTNAELTSVARRLFQWRGEMTRDRR